MISFEEKVLRENGSIGPRETKKIERETDRDSGLPD